MNEDPAMVKFLLDRDTDSIIHQERAFGVFFSCDDQNASRKDLPDAETLKISPETNYKGNKKPSPPALRCSRGFYVVFHDRHLCVPPGVSKLSGSNRLVK